MDELEEIRQQYERGGMEAIKSDLERFIMAHRQEIRNFKERQNSRSNTVTIDDATAVKFFILKHRTVNAVRDIQDQLREIEREKWIQGVNTGREPDTQRVASEWALRYSPGWRAHRVTSIVYVFDREKERYLTLLNEA